MLIFPLKKEWYKKIRSGEKTVEYREVKPYWSKRFAKEIGCGDISRMPSGYYRFCDVYIKCILRFGYTKQQMTAEITKIEVVDGKDTDLFVDKPVYAIHLVNVVSNE
ncbi:MAG: hypothetical protein HDR52_06170 [Treponema sp.]|nr:hypothetical protein [Treponema sp.]